MDQWMEGDGTEAKAVAAAGGLLGWEERVLDYLLRRATQTGWLTYKPTRRPLPAEPTDLPANSMYAAAVLSTLPDAAGQQWTDAAPLAPRAGLNWNVKGDGCFA